MKFDYISIMQIVIFCIFITSTFVLFLNTFKEKARSLKASMTIKLIKQALNYIIKLNIKDYNPYDKYEIWRFCIEP
jgi:hypothetical protein